MSSQGYLLCQLCRREVLQVTVEVAARLTGVSSRTIHMWASSGKVHVNLTPGGHLRVCYESLPPPAELPAAVSRINLRIRLAARLIDEQATCVDITLKKIAGQLDISIWHLARLFKKNMGVSFREYLRTIRLKKAEELLCSSGLSIKQVAAAVGYKYVSDFDHHFKMSYGLTPGEYRHLHAGRVPAGARQQLPTNSNYSQQ